MSDFPMQLVGEDAVVVETVVNAGIDSRLEAFTASTFEWKNTGYCTKLHCLVVENELPLLLRRLAELSEQDDDMGEAAESLLDSIVYVEYEVEL